MGFLKVFGFTVQGLRLPARIRCVLAVWASCAEAPRCLACFAGTVLCRSYPKH